MAQQTDIAKRGSSTPDFSRAIVLTRIFQVQVYHSLFRQLPRVVHLNRTNGRRPHKIVWLAAGEEAYAVASTTLRITLVGLAGYAATKAVCCTS